jgi:ubiquinone/menaquinone biosynthesis C-methylase UbiE
MSGLKPGMTIVDIGCGQGYFAIPAAKAAGENGRVLCIDIDEEAIGLLDRKASDMGLTNIKTFSGEAERTRACESCADIVFFGICLHDFDDPDKVLGNAMRMLKHGGTLIDLDWKKVAMEGGPPLEKRFSEQKATKLIEKAGFKIESVEEIEGRYYFILARSP